ncbi:MAG: hypothetical protein CO186_07895 [Zetaproteobacteria bacterium CG_4_9_14_3_um_filter_49_83]|nr:MAG: hypothetical protein AUJ56_04640 [Zetaproteobacteria bacterium CG1_02_49_23]PIQ33360.1 MAG: hypothetical protein COW62_05575 [Zetaproteobacteria bacterium CG17_big_fil_post_rev_8_21_14_2_50_50_13]PIV31486.1 MAG: hypothetical protein COS35_01160 [Zetaproteobacteria bacterium CG02_land_8_20_14_3_00_50_9]PIY57092.1 MAG: hypothetical protein COZ00_00755 [Zetaproteobacteria bacterium CG_4_10_14_0_8_um_filter_49_80]PJA35058.1 MAG: hypothetical protein CO186_07895 [Zetaproteobacteria bacterium
MGSLWQILMLAQWKSLFIDVPLESVIKAHQQEYYKALGSADSAADSSLTRQQMAEKIGKDIRTISRAISRAIKKLQDEGKLQRVGSDKSGHWELL